MQKINAYQLWNEDIIAPDELLENLPKIFKQNESSLIPEISFRNTSNLPPLFVYQEARDKQKHVTSFIYYGGRDNKSAIISHGARNLITITSNSIRSAERGAILDAFCQLDFVLDAMIAIDCGVFQDKVSYGEFEKLLKGDEGAFSTTNRKIRYLRVKKFLSDDTYALLNKVRKIRNILAHQYMPEMDVAITNSDLENYGSISKAIDTIFNACWFYLLKDYNSHQIVVVRWLLLKSNPQKE